MVVVLISSTPIHREASGWTASTTLRMIPEFITITCAGIFSAAAIYISLVQHLAAVKLGSVAAVRFFGLTYARAEPLQASLALAGSLPGKRTWCRGSGWVWLLSTSP